MSSLAAPRGRLVGVTEIASALAAGQSIAHLLVRADDEDPALARLVAAARDADVPVSVESEREMQRMTAGDGVAQALAVTGERPADTLAGMMQSGGLALVLVGLRYPGNVGFILRAAEVAGAAGVALEVSWSRAEHAAARRASIHADRFLPVLNSPAVESFDAAVAAGRRIVAVETSGTASPWSLDLRRPTALVVGGEAEGIPERLLARADETVRIPGRGFIPSYNVQAAVSILLGEWLRQTTSLV